MAWLRQIFKNFYKRFLGLASIFFLAIAVINDTTGMPLFSVYEKYANPLLSKYPDVFSHVGWHPIIFSFILTLIGIYNYRLYFYKKVVNNLGADFTGKIGHLTPEMTKRDLRALKFSEKVLSSRKLYILCATGWMTFGDAKSPLREVVEQILNDDVISKEITVKILLLNPKSEFAKQRARDVNVEYTAYKKEITKTIAECKKMKKKIDNLECAFYDRPPIWKLIATDTFVWQQYYLKGSHVQDCSVNWFVKTDDLGAPIDSELSSHALYPPFVKLFELLFDSSSKINLDARR